MSDITKRLHALARAEHDDLSVGDEAADEIEALKMHVERLQSTLSEYANKSNKDFNAGMETAAIRCTQIADTTRCGNSPHCACGDAITLKIIEEFGLEG
jgi:hypothetical protein